MSDLLKNTGQKIFPDISYHKPSDTGWNEIYVIGAHFDMKIGGCLLPSHFPDVLYSLPASVVIGRKLDFPLA